MSDSKPTTPTPQPAPPADTGTTSADSAGTTAPDPADAGLKGPEQMPGEIGGPKGPEPTRYGDWEFKGRCSDF